MEKDLSNQVLRNNTTNNNNNNNNSDDRIESMEFSNEKGMMIINGNLIFFLKISSLFHFRPL